MVAVSFSLKYRNNACYFLKKILTEVINPMSIAEERVNSAWNSPDINMVSAVNGKSLLTDIGMALTNEE